MVPKSSFGYPGVRFLRFCSVLGRDVFSTFWGTGKSRLKIWKSQPAELKKNISGLFVGRPGGMRGASGEVRRGLEPLRVRQDPGQESKNLKF